MPRLLSSQLGSPSHRERALAPLSSIPLCPRASQRTPVCLSPLTRASHPSGPRLLCPSESHVRRQTDTRPRVRAPADWGPSWLLKRDSPLNRPALNTSLHSSTPTLLIPLLPSSKFLSVSSVSRIPLHTSAAPALPRQQSLSTKECILGGVCLNRGVSARAPSTPSRTPERSILRLTSAPLTQRTSLRRSPVPKVQLRTHISLTPRLLESLLRNAVITSAVTSWSCRDSVPEMSRVLVPEWSLVGNPPMLPRCCCCWCCC